VTDGNRDPSRVPRREPAREARPPLTRRAVMVGAVPVVAAAAGAIGSLAVQISRTANDPGTVTPSSLAASPVLTTKSPSPATPVTVAATPVPAGSPAPTDVPKLTRPPQNLGVPEGMTLVASRRLPITGVGPEDPWRLLTGKATNWASLGSAVPLEVHPLALAGEMVAGVRPDQSFESYDALATAMDADPGAVALIPAQSVDFRVHSPWERMTR